MTNPKLNSIELNADGTDNYDVGTVKLERAKDGSNTALWVKVNRAVVTGGGHFVGQEWLCIQSTKAGFNGLARTPYYVQDFPVVGVVPMSSAAIQQVKDEVEQGHTRVFEDFWQGKVSS